MASAAALTEHISNREEEGGQRRNSTENENEVYEGDTQPPRVTPDSLQALERTTKFSREEIKKMYRGFKQECPSGTVTEETFKLIYAKFFPQGESGSYAHYVFNAMDKKHTGFITFDVFMRGMSVLCRGSQEEKLRWAFDLYDINHDGRVTREEMRLILVSVYEMMGNFVVPSFDCETIDEHVDYVFSKMDLNGDNVITYDEFMIACTRDETLLASLDNLDTII